ncbi:MAG: DUF4124 domain-containing protein [Burkholderiaceae bacterium]|nr:DUF4124 domain-containing protein [Burkholderiaceae bacterium]
MVFPLADVPPALRLTSGALCLLLLAGSAAAQGIYTCVDAKGRKITADRPIPDCMDRDQQELSRFGTVIRKVSPTLTAKERAAQDEKDKLAAVESARQQDEKRRERALLLRYPNRKAHDRERDIALAVVDDIIASSQKRTAALVQEREKINIELEFYLKDPSKAPPALKSRLESNASNQQAQQQFVVSQGLEKARLNRRFDEELSTLQQLWARNSAPPP